MSMTSGIVYVFPAGAMKVNVPAGFEGPTIRKSACSDSQSKTSTQRLSRNSSLTRFGSGFFGGSAGFGWAASDAANVKAAQMVTVGSRGERMASPRGRRVDGKLADYRASKM